MKKKVSAEAGVVGIETKRLGKSIRFLFSDLWMGSKIPERD